MIILAISLEETMLQQFFIFHQANHRKINAVQQEAKRMSRYKGMFKLDTDSIMSDGDKGQCRQATLWLRKGLGGGEGVREEWGSIWHSPWLSFFHQQH